MDIVVEPAQLAQLVSAHVDTLRGNQRVSAERIRGLGSLARYVVDDQGWRCDGLHRTRTLLSDLADAFAADGDARAYGGLGRVEMAQAARILWGIDRYPGSAQAAVNAIGVSKNATTLRRWENRILCDEAVLDCARRSVVCFGMRPSHNPTAAANAFRPVWTPPSDSWPPNQWNGGGRPTLERSRIVSLMRASLGENLRALHDSISPSDEVFIVREAVSKRLAAYFAVDPDSAFYRHLHHKIFREWFEHDILALYAPEAGLEPPSGGGAYRSAVAAAAQMLMYEAARDRSALLAALTRRIGLVRLLSALPERPPSGLIAVGQIAANIPGLSEQIYNEMNRATLTVRNVPQRTGLENEESPVSALDLAYTIRATAGEAKHVLAREYVRSRLRRVHETTPVPDREALALADQSVHWDLVTLEDEPLVRMLSKFMLERRALAKHGYLAHLWRCHAVVYNKRNDWRGALDLAHKGYETLSAMMHWEIVNDPVEIAETAHQIELALSGIYVRLLERSLLVPSGGRLSQSEYYARGALWWSRSAFSRLDFLDHEEGGLPLRRHQDGRISTVAWRVQTRIIRLRVLLAVRTALDSRICTEQGLRLAETGTPRVVTADIADLDDASIPSMLARFRELITRKEVATGHQLPIVHLAAWIAFLNHGRVPVERYLSPNLSDLTFLDCDPVQIEAGRAEVPIDLVGMTQWLCARGQDAGILNWLPPRGPAAKLLDRTSDHQYGYWRKMLVIPLTPSHD